MAATVNMQFDFGGADGTPGTEQNIDGLGPPTLRFKAADDATIDLNDPVTVPGGADVYSYWKHICLACTNADGNALDNFKFYTDGANGMGTGVDLEIGLQFPVKNSGSDAGYEVADAATDLVTGHGDITTVASVFDYTSGASLTGPSISEAGAVIDAAGEYTNYMMLQMQVSNTAGPGTT